MPVHGASSQDPDQQLLSMVRKTVIAGHIYTNDDAAGMGGTYEFARFAAANLREKNDSYNTAIGGFLAGAVLGLKRMFSGYCSACNDGCSISDSGIGGTTPAVLGFGALTAILMSAYDYTGGRLSGYEKDPEVDEFERKEYMRRNKRRPIEQTVEELGEGRGTTPRF